MPPVARLRRDAPLACLKIDLAPLGVAQLARPHEHQWCELQRIAVTFEPRSPSMARNNAATPSGSVTDAWCCGVLGGNAPRRSDEISRSARPVADRAGPTATERHWLRGVREFHRVARFPVRRVFLEPLARDRLEGIRGVVQCHELLLFACGAGIDAIGDQLAHLVAPIARLLQSDVRVYAERKPLLFVGEAILAKKTINGCRSARSPNTGRGRRTSGRFSSERWHSKFSRLRAAWGNSEIRTVFLASRPRHCPRLSMDLRCRQQTRIGRKTLFYMS